MSEHMQRRLSGIAIVGLLLAFGGLSPALHSKIQRQRDALPMASVGELTQRNSSPFALILGEFRASLSDFMFMKTERYLDSGIAYTPHINVQGMASEDARQANDLSSGNSVSQTHDEHHDHQEHPATLIRTQTSDFRGFLGDLEREIKPYRDPKLGHKHTTGEELLPWYRLMTMANPHQVRAYLIGAMWLSQQDKLPEAIAFLKEGTRNNPTHPDCFRLYLSLTTCYVRYRYKVPAYPDWQRSALQCAVKASELGLVQRKKNFGEGPAMDLSKMPERWQVDQQEDLEMSMHYVAVLQHEMGNDAAARQSALELQKIAPYLAPNNQFLKMLSASK